jgi:hypothetical protein
MRSPSRKPDQKKAAAAAAAAGVTGVCISVGVLLCRTAEECASLDIDLITGRRQQQQQQQ